MSPNKCCIRLKSAWRRGALGAGRNSPLAHLQRTVAGRSVSGDRFSDLNETLLRMETLVAYMAAAGTAAEATGTAHDAASPSRP